MDRSDAEALGVADRRARGTHPHREGDDQPQAGVACYCEGNTPARQEVVRRRAAAPANVKPELIEQGVIKTGKDGVEYLRAQEGLFTRRACPCEFRTSSRRSCNITSGAATPDAHLTLKDAEGRHVEAARAGNVLGDLLRSQGKLSHRDDIKPT